jgi:hypothetical protein
MFLLIRNGAVLVALIIAISLGVSCHHSTEPPPPDTKQADTTSHAFTWTVEMLGDVSPSSLYDVAVINDTLAYAVGEIYVRDSTGGYNTLPYNIAKWDGRQWSLKQVTVSTRFGLVTAPIEGIYAFSPTDIWLMAGDPLYGDGEHWTDFDTRKILGDDNIILSHCWGIESSDMYFAGDIGNIVRYHNGAWQKLPSGTTGTIQDVWGAVDPSTGSPYVLCAVAEAYSMGRQRILQVKADNSVDTIPWVADRRPYSVWVSSASQVFTCGDGVFSRGPDDQWNEIAGMSVLPVFTNKIRGIAPNDVFVAGDFGRMAHYNGSNFKVFSLTGGSAVFASLSYKKGLMVAVGYTASRAVVAIAKR